MMSQNLLKGLVSEVEGLNILEKSGQEKHRGDKIGWIGREESKALGLKYMPQALRIMLSELPALLHEKVQIEESRHVLSPERAMLSLYSEGAAYTPHRDSISSSELGLLGLPRAAMRGYANGGITEALVEMATLRSEASKREYTAILYLNPDDWSAEMDGGVLRIFCGCDEDDKEGGSATQVEDILPIGGRLVIFDSRTILHAVLPATRKRFAMTAWLLNEQSVLGQRTAMAVKEEYCLLVSISLTVLVSIPCMYYSTSLLIISLLSL